MSAQYVPHVRRGTLLFVSAEHGVGWPSVSTLWRAFDASARSTGAGSCLAEVEIATSARSDFPSLRASRRCASVTMIGLAMYPRVIIVTSVNTPAIPRRPGGRLVTHHWVATLPPVNSSPLFLHWRQSGIRQDRGSDPWLDFCCGGGLK